MLKIAIDKFTLGKYLGTLRKYLGTLRKYLGTLGKYLGIIYLCIVNQFIT